MNIFRLAQQHYFSVALLSAAAGWSGQVFATTCTPETGYGAMDYTMPLQSSNLTIGPDVADGTIIYRQFYKPSRQTLVRCTGNTTSYQPTVDFYYSSTPNPLSSWTGGNFSGKVYETGVAGIGIAIYRLNMPKYTVPFSYQAWQKDTTLDDITWMADTGFDFDIVLIKTGTITPGTVSGSKLPTVKYDFIVDGTKTYLGSLSFSGAINIVSNTCTTPDVTVPMGTHDVAKTFTSVGNTTSWVDASIKLTNCPRFYGTLNDGRNTWRSDDGTSGMGTITNNVLNLALSPNTSILDSSTGIIGLKTGSDSATGVGIQLAYGSTSDASPTLVDLSSTKDYTMQNDTSTTQSMPLVARYIQTESTVTAGRADATVTFTISYY